MCQTPSTLTLWSRSKHQSSAQWLVTSWGGNALLWVLTLIFFLCSVMRSPYSPSRGL